MVTTKRKVEMPAGIRNKLMAAVAMLLVATILMVSSTYAWFTLSTAPEVTGISTSVGANGNLEIALLNTDTYATPANITSAVGNSSANANTSVMQANITWGNLVDLSDASYGLTSIKLMPATANINAEGKLIPASLLMTPVYGADGRVDKLEANTVSAVKDATDGVFKYDSAAPTYGVRAVGVANNISPRQLTFSGAKSAVNGTQSSAANSLKNAVKANSNVLLAVAISGSAPTSYSATQVAGLLDMAKGAKNALNTIVLGYANAGLARAAAADGANDEQLDALKTALTSDAATLKTALTAAGVTAYDTKLDALATAQSAINTAITTLTTYATTGTQEGGTAEVTSAVESLYNDKFYVVEGIDNPDAQQLLDNGGSAYIFGGAIGAIATEVGVTELLEILGVKLYAGTAGQTAAFATVASALSSLTAPAGAAVSLISDTYGYAIDFAFRTNAAESNLELQTAAANRVYSDQTGAELATQGSGSNVTYAYTDAMNTEQVEKLMQNIRILFFDPTAGTIYAQGRLTDIAAQSGTATADIEIYKADAEAGHEYDDPTIVALEQNQILKLSVLVYLEGETIQNADVANAADSGTLDLNLQFSSSATLVPMDNTALKTMVG